MRNCLGTKDVGDFSQQDTLPLDDPMLTYCGMTLEQSPARVVRIFTALRTVLWRVVALWTVVGVLNFR